MASLDNTGYLFLDTLWQTMSIIDSEGYVPIDNLQQLPDGRRVEAVSRLWSELLLNPAVNPFHLSPPAKHSVHFATPSTFDVLRHDYTADDLRLVVRESVNVMFIRVEGTPGVYDASSGGKIHDHVNALASRTLRIQSSYVGDDFREVSFHWSFRQVAHSGGVPFFSTAPDVDTGQMWCWANRADCKVFNDSTCFLCFKIREPTGGRMVVLDSKHWFDGECWKPYE
ncbi:MAG: hypothetical protein L6Q76_04955 [Polyangiaceae bacterium]|nr:hypothetical protein [Polyangiaceae bacterium]